ncbi:SusC/RagA family TonB-linked outer membrane protein [Microbacter margulisiae]|uniref:TonB-linked SusC/RagA family outer membrane protein n=1 Tax=Microbacter margulisiae TaxID=1350067 RepID=A0A7W5DSX3_9PORP|nr:TonB-dependent receptor [Microbacter margulisiae]MBB3188487.1 TonB-linked SusC/RagA family outer membrane protein [Microbacter margulisiae]
MKKQFILIVAFMSIVGMLYAQTPTIDLSLKNVPLKACLSAIEKQCDYTFMYDNSINTDQPVTVEARQASLPVVLQKVFEHTSIRYEIVGKQIILKNKPATSSITFTGKVVDSQNEPLIGASVIVKGTSKGTITDVHGNFSISDIPLNTNLVVSYIGYNSKDIVANSAHQTITLSENNRQLNEVVVVGYGVQQKKLITGATVNVSGQDLQKLSTTNALQALQGQTAGVNITTTSGQPGGGIKVNIRGVGTIGNSNPTYVVDGVITNDISYLDNADIASVDVLKDAASAAIYGINGANGVVLITTRGGSFGVNGAPKAQISFDTYYGLQNVARKLSLLNAPEYATLQNEAAINSGVTPFFTQAQINAMGPGTNWLDEVLSKNVPTQNYNIAATGGNAASMYSLAFSYTDQGGIIGGASLSDYQRYNFRVNTEDKLYGNFMKLGEHFTYSHINQRGIQDQGIYNSSLRGVFNTSPFLAMYDANGNFLNSTKSTFYNGGPWDTGEANPYAMMLYTNQSRTNYDKLLGDVYLSIQPVKGLTVKSTFGLEYDGSAYHGYSPTYDLSATAINTTESISQSSSVGYTWNWDNTANYIFKVNKNHFDVLLGNSIRQYTGSWLYGSNQGSTLFGNLQYAYLSNSAITSIAASTSSTDTKVVTNTISLTGNANPVVAHSSFFGRINYDYNETYLATVVLRADGSTMFAPGYQWGEFPSFSAGWVITNEKFMAPTKNWLDFLKLRGSWGINGNDNISTTFAYESLIALSNATYNLGGTDVPGSYPNTIGTKNLKWESSHQLDFGFDARLLENLNVNFDWYNKTTKDWLVQAPLLATAGVSTPPYINGGDVTNKGVEVQLSYNNHIGRDFHYTVTGTYSYNRNNVTNIPTVDRIIHGGTNILFANSGEFYRAQAGNPIGFFWGYKTAGIFQSEADVLAWRSKSGKVLQPNAQPGDVKYVDVNGDGVIDANDKTDIGDPNPHHMFGATLSCTFKNFDFSVDASGVAGNKIAQSYREEASQYSNWTTAMLNRWHGAGTSNTMPRVTLNNSNWVNFSDLYLQNGAYLRINNVTLGYDFAKLINCKYIHQCRLYGSVENLFTFTKYNGMDPEVGFSTQGAGSNYNFGQGVDVGMYPRPRTYLVGLSVKF